MSHNSINFPLLDHVSSGIMAIDRNGHIRLWNKTLEEWHGSKREQILGESLYACFPHLDQQTFKELLNTLFSEQQTNSQLITVEPYFVPCPLPDGQFRTQQVTVALLVEHDLALFSIEDQSQLHELMRRDRGLAEQMKSELAHRESLEQRNKRLISAVDQAGEAVMITDRKGRLEYANKAFHEQTGWDIDETHSKGFYDNLFEGLNESFVDHLDTILRSGKTWQGRLDIACKSGSSFTASVSIAPISDANGFNSHAVIIQENISQQIAFDEKLRRSQKHEALTTLVGGIAHDFNNLLAGLTGQVYLASREVKEMPKTAERMKKIERISHEAAEIVKQLLTFSRRGEHDAKEFPLDAFIKEFSKLAQHTVPESIKWRFDFKPGNYAFRGDANQLQQSLLNIVQNSVEACENRPDSQIELVLSPLDGEASDWLITKYPVLRRGNFAHIMIRDSGSGIKKENLDKIFDPFYTSKQLGSGLGLAIVMGCVRHHHGIIDVESTPEEGTLIHLFLPVRVAKEEVDFSHPHGLLRTRILLVDDDPRVLEPTKELLESMGHTVELASDGIDACEKFKANINDWDIVITDMVMPRMGGLESAMCMREFRPDIPIIFATGYDRSLVLEKTRQMDDTVLIGKPFNPDELDQIILNMVKSS